MYKVHFCCTYLILVKGATIRYKLDREKCRFTYAPVLAVNGPLAGFKPMIISKVKGTRWADQVHVETKKIVKDSVEYTLEYTFRIHISFLDVIYSIYFLLYMFNKKFY